MRELGDFLRHKRASLPVMSSRGQGPRRTPGWRREEVAQAAGVSVTWYTWIEQGRDVSVSATALGRLAVTLRMDAAERAYLFTLAGKRDPAPEEEDEADQPALSACIEAISVPAYVLDRRWDALFWNGAAADLMGPWLAAGRERNLLRFVFLDPAARSLICDWESRAFRLVAEFRKDAGVWGEQPSLRTLVETLAASSSAFERAWRQHNVTARIGGARSFLHPTRGRLDFMQTSFDVADRVGLKMHILTPVPLQS